MQGEIGLGIGTVAFTSVVVALLIPAIVGFGSKVTGYAALAMLAVFGLIGMLLKGFVGAPRLQAPLAWAGAHPLPAAAPGLLLVVGC